MKIFSVWATLVAYVDSEHHYGSVLKVKNSWPMDYEYTVYVHL